MSIALEPISSEAADAVLRAQLPAARYAPDYPTEFSLAVVSNRGSGPLGPYFIVRVRDQIVVGEIAGALVEPFVAEIGYAVVPSAQGRGHATEAVMEFVAIASGLAEVKILRAHTPLDRPASASVLRKVGFAPIGLVEDIHEGQPISVRRWERRLAAGRPDDPAPGRE